MLQEEISTIPLEFKIVWKPYTAVCLPICLSASLFQGKLKWGHVAFQKCENMVQGKLTLVKYISKKKKQEYFEAN